MSEKGGKCWFRMTGTAVLSGFYCSYRNHFKTVLWRGVGAIFFLIVPEAFKQCSVSETVIFCKLEKQKSILVYGKPIIK